MKPGTESEDLADKVVDAIRSVVGSSPIPLHAPSFEGNEWSYLKECLDSTFVSSVGKFVDQFEENLMKYTGAKYAVSVVNGTAALHIALKLAGVQPDDEVLIPALTFVATANAVTYCNAVPHFVDSEEQTFGIDTIKLREYLSCTTSQKSGHCVNKRTGRIIRALVPMHAFGHPSDLGGLLSIAHEFNLALVEDAAEALGSFYKGKHVGTFGLLGTLSFNGNKTITTGGGGAILTNDDTLAQHAKHLTTTAKIKHSWEFIHDEIGYNYRMPNVNAALGCAQLEKIDEKLRLKRNLFNTYKQAFSKLQEVVLFEERPDRSSNYWLQTLLLNPEVADQRDRVLTVLNSSGYASRPVWRLLNELRPFMDCPKMNLEGAYSLQNRIINIPSNVKIK